HAIRSLITVHGAKWYHMRHTVCLRRSGDTTSNRKFFCRFWRYSGSGLVDKINMIRIAVTEQLQEKRILILADDPFYEIKPPTVAGIVHIDHERTIYVQEQNGVLVVVRDAENA